MGSNAHQEGTNFKKFGPTHFTDEEVIAGQGTIALEMLEEQPGLDAVIVPVGVVD